MTTADKEHEQAIQARVLATRVILKVLEGRFLDDTLNEFRGLPHYSSLVQELAYGTLRWYHRLDAITRLFLTRPLKNKDADIHVLLLVGIYQLTQMRVAAHAAVDLTVGAVAALGKSWAKGLVNACLRSFQRETARVDAAMQTQDLLRYSHPQWLIDKIRQDHPETWERILGANNERPPMTLRINGRHVSREDYLARLREKNLPAHIHSAVQSGVVMETPVPVEQLPGFAEGDVSVQDAAAQLAAELVDALPGERVLDACAAPGGKAAHILERTPELAELCAVELDPARRERLHTGLARLRLKANIIAGDASSPAQWWNGIPFDRILVDAPCSATGVIRRHPDIKVRRQPNDLAPLTLAQARILDGVWPCLKPGGKLWYVTCSVFSVENQQQVREFLERHTDAAFITERQILPGIEQMDGFYYACLRKV